MAINMKEYRFELGTKDSLRCIHLKIEGSDRREYTLSISFDTGCVSVCVDDVNDLLRIIDSFSYELEGAYKFLINEEIEEPVAYGVMDVDHATSFEFALVVRMGITVTDRYSLTIHDLKNNGTNQVFTTETSGIEDPKTDLVNFVIKLQSTLNSVENFIKRMS